jgi:hypothetical protein
MFVAEITDRFADGGSKVVSMMSTFVAPETESLQVYKVYIPSECGSSIAHTENEALGCNSRFAVE